MAPAPNPPPDKTIEVPFQTGLSQKSDPVWAQGATTVTNLVRQKDGAMQKRLGYGLIPNLGAIPAIGLSGGSSAALQSGERLASYKQAPVAIGRDTSTDGIWAISDTGDLPLLLDRVPEVYGYPYRPLAAGNLVAFAMDTAVCNGYEVHAWTACAAPGTPISVMVTILDAARGDTVVGPTPIFTTVPAAVIYDNPQLTVCGTTVVLTVTQEEAGTNSVLAATLNMTAPWGQWVLGGAISGGTSLATYAYCAAPVIGDPTRFAIIYETTTPDIQIAIYTASPLALVMRRSIGADDTTWTLDAPDNVIQGFALRVDSVRGEIAAGYSWLGPPSSTTMRASIGLYAYPTGNLLATPVNVFSVPGPLPTLTTSYVQTVGPPSILTIGLESTTQNDAFYNLYLSPSQTEWPRFFVTGFQAGNPYLAHWLVNGKVAGVYGTMTVQANSPRVTWGLVLWSRVLELNSIGYVVAYCPSSVQGSFFLLADDSYNDLTTVNTDSQGTAIYFPLRVVCNIAPRLSSGLAALSTLSIGLQSKCAVHIAANPYLPGGHLVYQTVFALQQSPSAYGPARIAFDFTSAIKDQPSEFGDNLLLCSGCPSLHDGAQSAEINFPIYPQIASVSNGGTGTLPGGTYSYIAVAKWTDAKGTVHQSRRSPPVTFTSNATQALSIQVSTIGFTSKLKTPPAGAGGPGPQAGFPPRNYPVICIYRTANGGTVYNEVTAGPYEMVATVGGAILTYTDNAADTAIAAFPLCYGDGASSVTPGAILDDECPPAFQSMIVHQTRVFGVDGSRIWPSKFLTTGAGPGFNEQTVFEIDDGSNPCTALASMDGNLIIFKSDKLFLVSGLGPDDNGANNDWSPPQRIASDTGALDWRSVVSTQEGTYFMSPAGRRLLTRDLQVQPVPVVETNDQSFPAITGAVLHPTNGRIVWSQNTDDVTIPRRGILTKRDYVLDAWTQDGILGNAATVVGLVSLCVASKSGVPTLYGLRVDGDIVREHFASDPNPYLDQYLSTQTAFVPFVWTSPWIKSDGLVGWSIWRRVRGTMRLLDPAAFSLAIAINYNPTPVEFGAPNPVPYPTVATWTGTFLTQWEHQFGAQVARAEAIQLTIGDVFDPTNTLTGQGYALLGLRIDYGVEPGGYRTPLIQRI